MKKILTLLLIAIFIVSFMPVEAKSDMDQIKTKVQENKEKAIQNYEQAKERYQTAKQTWDQAKTEFQKIKNKLNESNQSTERITKTRNFVLRTAERMEDQIRIMQRWTEKVVDDEELEENILNLLEEDLNQITRYKKEIQNAGTIEEIRTQSRNMKEFWNKAKNRNKRHIGIILSHRIYNIIQKSEDLYEDLQEKINSSDCNNTETIQDLSNNVNENLNLSKEKYEQAKEKYLQINDSEDAKGLLSEVKILLRESHNYLRGAHKNLKQIIKEYRMCTNNILEEDDEEENETENNDKTKSDIEQE